MPTPSTMKRPVAFRLEEETRLLLETLAEAKGQTVSELIRSMVLPEWLAAQHTDPDRRAFWKMMRENQRQRERMEQRLAGSAAAQTGGDASPLWDVLDVD